MKIVAVAACLTGVAHTYMATASLEKSAKAANVEIKVEIQGAMGIENKLSQSEIDEAHAVIFAIDTSVVGRERFEGKKIIEVRTADTLRRSDEILQEAINIGEEK